MPATWDAGLAAAQEEKSAALAVLQAHIDELTSEKLELLRGLQQHMKAAEVLSEEQAALSEQVASLTASLAAERKQVRGREPAAGMSGQWLQPHSLLRNSTCVTCSSCTLANTRLTPEPLCFPGVQVKQYEQELVAQATAVAAMGAEQDGYKAAAQEATERSTVRAPGGRVG
jgi:hypothetical protein